MELHQSLCRWAEGLDGRGTLGFSERVCVCGGRPLRLVSPAVQSRSSTSSVHLSHAAQRLVQWPGVLMAHGRVRSGQQPVLL
ncbi:hypothetical protein R3I93_017655 [Phoxinus phoxinus]|uniref:Uncharacterized protein n=1 Tax=Phoxinus phoxinus TaxID=58324 RepID=A0AAN9CEE1_9TELE